MPPTAQTTSVAPKFQRREKKKTATPFCDANDKVTARLFCDDSDWFISRPSPWRIVHKVLSPLFRGWHPTT